MADTKKVLTLAEKILAQNDLPQREVTVALWKNQKFIVKGMTGKERFDLIKKCSDSDGEIDGEKMTALSVAFCVKNPDTGDRVFTDAQSVELMGKSAAALQDLMDATNSLNGLGEMATEDIEKN